MNCPNCGTSNNVGSKFCIRCGQSLEGVQVSTEQPIQSSETSSQEVSSQPINNTPIQNENNFQTNVAPQQPMNTNAAPAAKVSFMGYFFIILAVILKPFTAFKEELNKFNSFKNSAIMSLIVSGVGTLINLITTMLNSVMVKSYDWSSGGYKTTWTWENLKEIKYLEVVGKNFLIYLGVIVAIAVVYYIASLIVKKQTNFSRLLGISAIAVAPMLVCSLVLSPLLALIWAELAMPITLIGAIYTIVLVYEGMNNEVLVEGNAKYYFNLVCLSILGIAAYYLYMKLFMSSISGGLEDIMDLFG
ncbi:MAG: hypothetical protein IJA30_07480 [Bacilli bacterium]|nr:hypothetical protein [Bacilli bacterium]MBQ3512118.1 hypothetical protein [Bacilli bacterium]